MLIKILGWRSGFSIQKLDLPMPCFVFGNFGLLRAIRIV